MSAASAVDESAPALGVLPGFSIAVPGDWIVVDLEVAHDRSLVEQSLERGEQLDPATRESVVQAVINMAEFSLASGVVFAAVLVVPTQPGAIPELTGVTISGLHVPQMPITSPPRTPDPGPQAEVRLTSTSTSRPPEAAPTGSAGSAREQVSLPAGEAMRVERQMAFPLTSGITQELYTVQYLLPVDEAGLTMSLMATSTAVRRKDDLDRVFAEIAATIELDRD